MRSKIQFNIRRLGLLLWNDIWSMRHTAALVAITVPAALTIFVVIAVSLEHSHGGGSTSWNNYQPFVYLLSIGIIWTSMAFTNLGSTPGIAAFTMLPASREEKFIARWLLTTVGSVIGVFLIFQIHILLCKIVIQPLFSEHVPLFIPFSKKVGEIILAFFAAHSVMFLGAIYFKRLVFFKTLFILVVLTLALSVFMLLLVRLFFWNDIIYGGIFTDVFTKLDQPVVTLPVGIFRIFFYYLLAPLCWTIAYFRFRETEV